MNAPLSASRIRWLPYIVAATFFMEYLDTTVIATALPQMARSFGVGPNALSLGMTAYMLALAIFIPISGWVADRYGSRTVFAAAIVGFTLSSVLCGMSNSVLQFTAARVLQGIGGAMMVPVGRLVVVRITDKSRLMQAIATITWPGIVAPVVGPPIGGFITTYASWRWIFLLNVPFGLAALAQSLEREGPIVLVNVGGVSNITYIDGAEALIACDTGPGNALLDDFMFRVMGKPFDCEGRLAAEGSVDEAWLRQSLRHPFFVQPPPKSLDRNDFAALKLGEMAPPDGAATLTAFTAASIAAVAPLLPKLPKSWIVLGGGARNLTLLRMLRQRLEPASVETGDGLGWSSDAIEAQAFGYLAARGLKGLPLSYPATTGVPLPMTGGVMVQP